MKRTWIKRPQYQDSPGKLGSTRFEMKRLNRKFRRANKRGADPEIVTIPALWWH